MVLPHIVGWLRPGCADAVPGIHKFYDSVHQRHTDSSQPTPRAMDGPPRELCTCMIMQKLSPGKYFIGRPSSGGPALRSARALGGRNTAIAQTSYSVRHDAPLVGSATPVTPARPLHPACARAPWPLPFVIGRFSISSASPHSLLLLAKEVAAVSPFQRWPEPLTGEPLVPERGQGLDVHHSSAFLARSSPIRVRKK